MCLEPKPYAFELEGKQHNYVLLPCIGSPRFYSYHTTMQLRWGGTQATWLHEFYKAISKEKAMEWKVQNKIKVRFIA